MTCIVGVEHNGKVTMGGDSAGVSGWSLAVRSDEKVFSVGPYVMGFAFSFRMGNLLRYSLDAPIPPKETEDLHRFMVNEFVESVRECFTVGGFSRSHDNEETGGNFLVGIYGILFNVDDDYQVGRTLNGYSAIGCGSDLALGAMYANRNAKSAKSRVTSALEAAEMFSAGVQRPFTVITK